MKKILFVAFLCLSNLGLGAFRYNGSFSLMSGDGLNVADVSANGILGSWNVNRPTLWTRGSLDAINGTLLTTDSSARGFTTGFGSLISGPFINGQILGYTTSGGGTSFSLTGNTIGTVTSGVNSWALDVNCHLTSLLGVALVSGNGINTTGVPRFNIASDCSWAPVLGAGTAGIGKLTANAGVNIGTVTDSNFPATADTNTGASGVSTLRTDSNLSIAGVAVSSGTGASGTGTIRTDSNLSIAGVAVSSGLGASGTGTVRTASNLSLAGVAVAAGDGVAGTGTIRTTQAGTADISCYASAARTGDPAAMADQTNGHYVGLKVIIDVTAVAGTPGNVIATIQGKDEISGKYYTLLASATLSTVATTVLTVFPGATITANLGANDRLPHTWRVLYSGSNANSITCSIGASYLN